MSAPTNLSHTRMAPVEDIRCPNCQDIDSLSGRPGPDGRRLLTCGECDHQWSRTTAVSCPRCGETEPYVARRNSWQYDDLVEASEDAMAAYDDVIVDEYRCRRCNHHWRVELERRAGRSGEPFQRSLDPRAGR